MVRQTVVPGLIVVATFVLGACASTAPNYALSIPHVEKLKDSGASPVSVDQFSAQGKDANDASISIRGGHMVPAQGSYAKYLQDALSQELAEANLLDPKSKVKVSATLLKNDIEQHEYWLVTNSLVQDKEPAGFTQWMKWGSSAKQTENGAIPFHYTQLSQLKNELPPPPHPQLTLSKKVKMLTFSREYKTDIITLFHAAGDFNYRARWQEGVKKVEEIFHFLPRVGMRSKFLLDSGETLLYTSSYAYHQDRIEFSETDEGKNRSTYFVIEKAGDGRSRLTLSLYVKKNIIAPLLFNLTKKKKMEIDYQKSLLNLETLLEEIPSFFYPGIS